MQLQNGNRHGVEQNPASSQIIQTMQRLKFLLLLLIVLIVATTYFVSFHFQFNVPLTRGAKEIEERHLYQIHSWQGKSIFFNLCFTMLNVFPVSDRPRALRLPQYVL